MHFLIRIFSSTFKKMFGSYGARYTSMAARVMLQLLLDYDLILSDMNYDEAFMNPASW